jgi:hypothetical protein
LIARLPVGWAGRLALRRLLTQWRSLLTIIAGALLSASVGALVPLYTTAVAQVGMVEKFNQLPVEDVHASADLSRVAAKTPDFAGAIKADDSRFREMTNRRLGQPFPGWLNRIVFFGETSALAVDPPAVIPEPGAEPVIPNPTTRVFVAYYEGWPEAVSLISGRLPGDSPADPGADIEIVVPFEAQNSLGVNVGDVLLLDQGGPKGGWPSSRNVLARVVGVASAPEQLSPVQRAYLMPPSPLRVTNPGGDYKAEYPALTTRAAFERVATQFIPDTPTLIGWRLLFDHTRLPFARSPEARQALFDFEHDLDSAFGQNPDVQFNTATGLINWQTQSDKNIDTGALLAYEQSVKTLDAPFGLLLLQVGALVIFFLVVTASLVRRGERREIAMLQSRGAMDRQVIAFRGIEALLICALAALVAPVIAQQVLIAITPFFSRYQNLPLQLTPPVFAYSAGAASVAFVALLTTLRPALRLPLVTSGGAALRSDRQPWWQRYYLDVILFVLGLAALWRLIGKESPLFLTTAGSQTTDPFLLLAPALLFLGLGSILLRLFPAIAGIAARILAAGRSLTGPLATWQLSREPVHYGRITLLLALAIGIGWFATSFRATVNRSQSDQAQYKVGSDVRFTERDMRLNVVRTRPEATYTQIPGVTAATITWRQPNVNFQPSPASDSLPGDLLAVDSDTFQQAVYWRPDLGSVQTPRPPGQPVQLPERGAALPGVPQKLALWANFTVRGTFGMYAPDLDRLRNRTAIYARLLDRAGAWIRVPFKVVDVEYISAGPQSPGAGGGGDFLTDGWAYLEADLTSLSYRPVEPVRLVSLYWQHRGRSQQGERQLRLTLAGLTMIDASGHKQPLDLFGDPGWQFAYDSGATSEGSVSPTFTDSRHGPGLLATWDQSAETTLVGLLLNYPAIADVPMIAGDSLIDRLGVQPGQTIKLRDLERLTVPFKIVGSQRYYPTLYDSTKSEGRWTSDDRNHPFAVVDRDALLYWLNRRPSATVYPGEVWLRTAPGTDIEALLAALRPADHSTAVVAVQTLPGELSELRTDPLSLGLLGLMFLAFIVALALSIVGLLTYAALTAEARRVEFGVLRALGLPSLRLVWQLALEQGFVIGLGALLGGTLGAVLSSQVVPRLAQDASSKAITPPFVVQVESAALLQYAGVVVAVLGLVLLISLVLVSRLSLSQTLRLGDE